MKVDINSDMGEGFGAYRIGDDEPLMGIVSSANVACGSHAGDPITMDRTVRMAKAKGVGIGAHPGLPDLLGFGRRVIQMDAGEIEKHMLFQIGALQAIAANAGHRVTHVSFHAAMGNMVNADPDMADVAARAILVHSDTPGSVNLAATVRRVVEQGGGEVVPATVLLG